MAQPRWTTLGLRGAKDVAVLIVYAAMLCFAVSRYQPWEDEGRAWMDARTSGLFAMVFHTLRFEGHPALWYVLLWPFVHLHVPYSYINWISALCGLTGVYVLLRLSPFPFVVRALLPFGFSIGYQYAVVARSYCLFPLLGFIIAHEYRQVGRRPVRMAIALALLANLSIHGALVAMAFAIAYAWDLWRERGAVPTRGLPRGIWAGVSVFAAALIFVAVVLWPAPGLKAPLGPKVNQVFHKVFPTSYRPGSNAPAPRLLRVVQAAPPQGTRADRNFPAESSGTTLRGRLAQAFLYPVASFAAVAIAFELIVVWFVLRRGKLVLLLAPLVLATFLVVVYVKLWHTGLMWITLLMVLWAVWNEADNRLQALQPFTVQRLVTAALIVVCVLQLRWTAGALLFERGHSTYPAAAAAGYLRTLSPRLRVEGFDHTFTLLPYFETDPFYRRDDALDNVASVIADRPQVIVLRETSISDEQMSQLEQAGFRPTRDFCGAPWFPDKPVVPICLEFLERAP